MEEEVDDVVGPTGKHDVDRMAVRHGHEDGEVTLGGRRVPVKRPRVRSADGEAEVPLSTSQHFADRDPLSRLVLEQMLAGVSTRRFHRTREPVGSAVEASAAVKQRLRRAWADDDHDRALSALQTLASELEHSHPGAAASLKEGMAETLTVTRLHIRGALKR